MAQTLEQFDFRSSGGREAHPWDEWSDGRIWKLTKGEDFECKSQTIATQARSQAKKRGVKVRVSAPKDGDEVVLQFFKPDGAASNGAAKARRKKS